MCISLKSFFLASTLSIATFAGLSATPAEARDWHGDRGYHRGWDRGRDHDHYRRDRHSHGNFSISFGQWIDPTPAYIPTYNYVPTPAPMQYPAQYVQTTYTPPAVAEGRYCREYNTISQVAGRAQNTYGTACMQPDGSWEIVD